MKGLTIILDCDQVLADFVGGFEDWFSIDYNSLQETQITEKVNSLKKSFKFWTTLPKLTDLDFEPSAYCTARINSKYSTKVWLSKNGFPDKPVYQVHGYGKSKVPQLKRIPKESEEDVKILIDDSWHNVEDAINAGIPALLLDTPYNQQINTPLRIKDIKFKTICNAYRRFYF